jgi:serine/threonine protein kinase
MVACPGCQTKVFIPADLPPLATTPCPKCSAKIMMPMRLRQFELRSLVGTGGMAKVYRAYDTVLQRMVAVKMMRPEIEKEPKGLENFYREARVTASLNHTNIIQIYNYDELEGQRYLVMELADCGSLDGRIEKQQRVSELEVLDVGIKISSALDLALKHNLLHRDLKPGNILFNTDNEPKLVDFGLARGADADEDEGGTWGTPYYVAPEKIKREKETFLSDMYSLGGTLYHALTGHPPFEAPTVEELVSAQVHTPLTPPNLVIPEVTQSTSDALVRTLAKEPRERFGSYDELKMVLEAARSHLLASKYARPSEGGAGGKTSWWRR